MHFENHLVIRAKLCGNKSLLFSNILEAMLDQHQELIELLVQKFEDVKRSYDFNTTDTAPNTKQKRGWEPFDFIADIPVIGHFYEILKSPTDNKKLKDHLRDLEWRFEQFAAAVQGELSSVRKFQNEVLEVVDAGFQKVFQQIHGLKCDIASLGTLLIL